MTSTKPSNSSIYETVAQHAGIIVLLFLGFMIRSYLAPWRSYWHDELLSVYYYGAYHDSLFAAIRTLGENSIHPPLYQTALYLWMMVFGDSELATRSLSNLYVVGATLFLYLFALRVCGRRVALGAALIFTLMYFPMRYGMEARSYAQSLFLACLSSWLFVLYVTKLPRPCHWKELLVNWRFVWLILANTALLMTHYYNVFFLGAQGLFLWIYFLSRTPRLSWLVETAKVAAVSATPILVLFSVWGWAMARKYEAVEAQGKYNTDFPSLDPWSIFIGYVIEPNFRQESFQAWLSLAAAVILVGFAAKIAWAFHRSGWRPASDRTYFLLYILVWALVPCVMAFVLFLVAHAERYSARYFIFCAPPVAIITLLAFEELVALLNRGVSWISSIRPARYYVRYALIFAVILAVALVEPGARRAASLVKEDIRGVAEMVIRTVEGDPGRSYILYEGNLRSTLDYYLARMRKNGIRVSKRVLPTSDKAKHFVFETDEIEKHDFLIFAFTHKRLKHYPNSVKRLDALYDRQFQMLDNGGRGIIVYKTKK